MEITDYKHSRKLRRCRRRSSHGEMYIRHIIVKGGSGDAEYVMVCVGYEIDFKGTENTGVVL